MHTAQATQAGRQPMARTGPDTKRFGAWLRPLMLARELNQTDLRKLLEAAGIVVGRQTVSQWYNGDNVPLPDTVVLIAQILRVDPAEAIREAGHGRVADLVARAVSGAPETAVEPVDPVIGRIINDPLLPSDLKERAIAFYLRRRQQAEVDAQEFAEGLRD